MNWIKLNIDRSISHINSKRGIKKLRSVAVLSECLKNLIMYSRKNKCSSAVLDACLPMHNTGKDDKRFQQNGRLPSAYFAPSYFWKRCLKNENVSFQITIYILKFFELWNLLDFFSRKTSRRGLKRHVQEIIPFNKHFKANFPLLAIFKNNVFFFSKNPSLSENQNVEGFGKSEYFSRVLRQICYKLVERNSPSETSTNIVNAIAKTV